MKFESAKSQKKYNDLWNNYAVAADKKIKATCASIGFFSEQKPVYEQCLKQYAQAVITILSDLSRHLDKKTFTDSAYIKAYMNRTLNEAREDFAEYRRRMVLRYTEKSDIVGFIDASLQEFNRRDPFSTMETQSDEDNSLCSSMEV